RNAPSKGEAQRRNASEARELFLGVPHDGSHPQAADVIGRSRGPSVTKWFFLFFFFSGFCSLVDEVVWLRLAMASFGVTTPFISIVLSVFMGGLALGSWGAGKLSRRLEPNGASASLRAYAFAELIIGLSAIAVPAELRWGQAFMERGGGDVAWASSSYYLASGTWI